MAQLIGDTLGPYRILERLGVGGMAEVYRAYQPSMDRYVAIKVILQRFAQDATFLQRFQREARAVSRLEHPFILPVHDYGEAEGRPYLVMRHMGEGTLKDRLSGQPMPLRDVNRIIGQVGGALDYAHRMGIIHRDVKPSNILMDNEGNTFLTDFGLAKIMEASVQLTGTGVGIGTPAYMSPEQGQGETVDSRTDVYSLGVMLYEMALGRRPYYADTPLAVVYKHVHEPLPLPRSIRPDLPETVERVILRAMAKDADDRFPTVGDMVRALDAAVRSAEGSRLAAPKPVAGAPQLRRTALWLVPLLLVLIAALLATWRPWTPPKTAAVETVVAEEGVAATMAPGTPSLGPPSPEATATRGIVLAASVTREPTNTSPPTSTPSAAQSAAHAPTSAPRLSRTPTIPAATTTHTPTSSPMATRTATPTRTMTSSAMPPTAQPPDTSRSPGSGTAVLVVQDKDGRPCQGKQVELVETHYIRRYLAVLDDRGQAIIEDVIPGGYTWIRTGCTVADFSDVNLELSASETVTKYLQWDPRPSSVLTIHLRPSSGFPPNAVRLNVEVVGMFSYFPQIEADGSARIEQRPGRTIRLSGFMDPGSVQIPAQFNPDTFGPFPEGRNWSAVVDWESLPAS